MSSDEADDEPVENAESEWVEVMTTSLDNQSASFRELVVAAIEATRSGEEVPASEVNAIRTELDEIQAIVEDFLAGRCDDTEPWDGAGIHLPRERLEERLDELSEVA